MDSISTSSSNDEGVKWLNKGLYNCFPAMNVLYAFLTFLSFIKFVGNPFLKLAYNPSMLNLAYSEPSYTVYYIYF